MMLLGNAVKTSLELSYPAFHQQKEQKMSF